MRRGDVVYLKKQFEYATANERANVLFSACDRPSAFKCAFVYSNLKKKIAQGSDLSQRPLRKIMYDDDGKAKCAKSNIEYDLANS